jgi:hypothetical protein
MVLRVRVSSDLIQFWILIVTVLCALGGLLAYCEGHFAKADELRTEVEERRELKMEVDAIYERQIPKAERVQLKFHQKGETHVSN